MVSGKRTETVAKCNAFKTFEKLVYKVSVMLFKRFPEQNLYKRFQDQSLWFTGYAISRWDSGLSSVGRSHYVNQFEGGVIVNWTLEDKFD